MTAAAPAAQRSAVGRLLDFVEVGGNKSRTQCFSQLLGVTFLVAVFLVPVI
jgi:hypothetical protein